MQTEFSRFYKLSQIYGGKTVDWKRLQQHFNLKQKEYPTDGQIYKYFVNTFETNTSAKDRTKWHRMDKLVFIWAVAKYCEHHGRSIGYLQPSDFAKLSNILGVSDRLLKMKWLKLSKPYLRKIPWSSEQDQEICQLMGSDLASHWTEITLKLFQKGQNRVLRTSKQVRERWANYIDPHLRRDQWSCSEEHELTLLIQQFGTKWSYLGRLLKRSQNSIKNRYFSILLKVKKQTEEEDCIIEKPQLITKVNQPDQAYTNARFTSAFTSSLNHCSYRLIVPGIPYNQIKVN